ncbi:hypothetical protein C8R34_10375 [Nitrosomonas sp. Nm84]|uniref:hypothetical protein n=1 Tax=Nitrosomonas sp. Nm84 TaxID=200124 RepID=UPI000D769176|nr:hypothetical protein [Nitrosomonas sp. Nm84]PXW89918.1 hypothetical protein C8R34_10375 [Nitrosomonas sp. Nm84]
MGFVNERLENHEWQTIDRERDIVLKEVGWGGPEDSTYDFNLDIAGESVNFSAHQKIISLGRDKGYDIKWQVLEIYAPPRVKQDKLRLHNLIAEALDAYGFAASRKNVTSLVVTFVPNI